MLVVSLGRAAKSVASPAVAAAGASRMVSGLAEPGTFAELTSRG